MNETIGLVKFCGRKGQGEIEGTARVFLDRLQQRDEMFDRSWRAGVLPCSGPRFDVASFGRGCGGVGVVVVAGVAGGISARAQISPCRRSRELRARALTLI